MDLFELQAKITLDTREYDKGIDSASKKNNELVSSFKNVNNNSETLRNKINVVSAEYGKARSKVQELTAAFNKSAKENGATSKTTQELAEKLNKAESEANDLKTQLNGLIDSSKKTGNSFSGLGEKIKSGLATAAKVGVAALTTAAAGVSVLVKKSVDSYGEYEQLVGGVETLFKDSAGKVQEYAANAYKTSGMSANEYMETVTSFSASLLQSLGGDTERAALYADGAITDMADNANKMGTSIESIQYAYQGFAKQNYTMLDNLKLGYGGTKEEMVRLVNDAHAVNGAIKENDLSFQNIVAAIHVVQTELGITGTTAKEAATTIQGSSASMKAAWQNLLVGFANGNADLSGLIGQFVDSVKVYAGNIMPVISQALQGIGQLVTQLAPIIARELPGLVGNILPQLIRAAGTLINGVLNSLPGLVQVLIQYAPSIIAEFAQGLISALPRLADTALQLIREIGNGITNNFDQIWQIGSDIVHGIIDGAKRIFPELVSAMAGVLDDIGAKLSEKIPALSFIFDNLSVVVGAATGAFIAFKGAVAISGVLSTVVGFLQKLKTATEGQTVAQALLNIVMNANPFMLIVTAIGALVGGIVILWNKCEGFRERVKQIFEDIKNFVLHPIETIKNALGKGGKEAGDNLVNGLESSVKEGKGTLENEMLGAGRDMVTGAQSGFESSISGFDSTVSDYMNSLGVDMSSNVLTGFNSNIASVNSDISSLMTNVGSDMAASANTGFDSNISGVGQSMSDAMIKVGTNTGANTVKSIVSGINDNIGMLKSSSTAVAQKFINEINLWMSKFVQIGKVFDNNIANGISSGVNNIVTTARKLAQAVISALNSVSGSFNTIGRNMASGVLQGFQSMQGTLESRIRQMMQNLVSSVKQEMQIHSPSGVFADIGENMALGLAKGWDNNYSTVSNDIKNSMGTIATNSSNVATSGIESGSSYNMQVTINLNGSDYTSQRQIAEEISVQLQNLVNRRSAAWA